MQPQAHSLLFCLHGKTVPAVWAQPDAGKAPPPGTQGWRLSQCCGKGVKTGGEKVWVASVEL